MERIPLDLLRKKRIEKCTSRLMKFKEKKFLREKSMSKTALDHWVRPHGMSSTQSPWLRLQWQLAGEDDSFTAAGTAVAGGEDVLGVSV